METTHRDGGGPTTGLETQETSSTRGAVDDLKKESTELGHEAAERAKGMAKEAREEVEHAAGGALDSIADQLEALAQELRGQDLETLFERAQAAAHRSPELFFAGSVAAGFAMSRFAKSSARKREDDDRGERELAAHEREQERDEHAAPYRSGALPGESRAAAGNVLPPARSGSAKPRTEEVK